MIARRYTEICISGQKNNIHLLLAPINWNIQAQELTMRNSTKKQDILVVEDTKSQAIMYEECLSQAGYTPHMARNGEEALQAFETQNPDAVLLDLGLPDIHGFEILKHIRESGNHCPVIVFTAEASVNTAVEAIQEGADDFLAKPVSCERLQVTITNALEKHELQKIAQTYDTIARDHFCGFIGASPEMQSVYRIIENAAASKAAVLITGESGTGKELAAQAIHQLGSRKNKNIIALNCAAIPHNLLESEIFGHVKGAFTGAIANNDGAAKRADGGTLFLDELGEMPMDLQSKLLRFIQTGTFTPVGGSAAQKVDVRFVCATNRDPLDAVKQGLLREDLYYRLNVIPVDMPPLRTRGNDILLLAEAFLKWAAQEEQKAFRMLAPETKALLRRHSWPGNVRELENVIWNAVVMHNGEALTPDMLRLEEVEKLPYNVDKNLQPVSHRFAFTAPDHIRPFRDLEKEIIENAVNACGGNITEAAKRLDINPSTIHRKQKAWKNATP